MKWKLSLVIVPVDDYTNKVLTEDKLRISLKMKTDLIGTRTKTAMWKQGFYVFFDVKEQDVIIQIESKFYQSQVLHLTLDPNAVLKQTIRLVPNELYGNLEDYTILIGKGHPGEQVKFYCNQLTEKFRLARDYQNENTLELTHHYSFDFSGKEIWIKGREQEWFTTLGTRLEDSDSEYRITPLNSNIRRVEAIIYPVYQTKCKEDGTFILFLPEGEKETFQGRFVCGEKENVIEIMNHKINQV